MHVLLHWRIPQGSAALESWSSWRNLPVRPARRLCECDWRARRRTLACSAENMALLYALLCLCSAVCLHFLPDQQTSQVGQARHNLSSITIVIGTEIVIPFLFINHDF